MNVKNEILHLSLGADLQTALRSVVLNPELFVRDFLKFTVTPNFNLNPTVT